MPTCVHTCVLPRIITSIHVFIIVFITYLSYLIIGTTEPIHYLSVTCPKRLSLKTVVWASFRWCVEAEGVKGREGVEGVERWEGGSSRFSFPVLPDNLLHRHSYQR